MLIQFLPFILIFVIMYFLIIRPQRQQAKRHQEMIANVRRGDTIVTTGGLIGKVAKVVDDSELQLELAENVRVRVVARHDRRGARQGRAGQGERLSGAARRAALETRT